MSIVFKRQESTQANGKFYIAYDGDTRVGSYVNDSDGNLGDVFTLFTDQDQEAEYDSGYSAGAKGTE